MENVEGKRHYLSFRDGQDLSRANVLSIVMC